MAKRYTSEVGTPLANALFTQVPQDRMMCLNIGTGEVISILVRKKNSGLLTSAVFTQAMNNFRAEVVDNANFKLVSTADSLVLASHPLIEKYSMNATDALILQTALEITATLGIARANLVLISSDNRLLRATQAEGLVTFNPEMDSQAQIDILL